MANWSDPRPSAAPFGTTATTGSTAYDAGLRSYMLSVYNYMTSGVLLTGIVALLFAWGGRDSMAAQVFLNGGALRYVIMFAPLGFVFALSMGVNRMKTSTMQLLFWAFAVVMGLSLSTIFLVYSGGSIAGAFFATAAGFAALSLYGYTTKRDLSAFGTFLIIGLVGLIVASVINIFLQSGTMGLVISFGDAACRNFRRAGQRDQQMGIVATHPAARSEGVERGRDAARPARLIGHARRHPIGQSRRHRSA